MPTDYGLQDDYPDSDADGLSDAGEARYGTNPHDPDSDDDGILDGREITETIRDDALNFGEDIKIIRSWRSDPLSRDGDGDGLEDPYEQGLGTDPNNWDTDGDALGDAEEHTLGTDPFDRDTDRDGLSDGDEVNRIYSSDPRNADTDGDGWSDGREANSSSRTPARSTPMATG